MKKSSVVWTLILMSFLFTACSKDRRMERRLHGREGKWNIDRLQHTDYINGVADESSSANNAGFIVFEKNGSLFLGLGDQIGGGTWANTSDQVILAIFGEALVFDVSDESRKNLTLTTRSNYTDSTWRTTVMKISKEK